MSAVKQKIAILGGGMAGLSAAWHLTQMPNADRRFEITVYQMGWRLGGKCASARNIEPNRKALRIEEHGIHVFGGCYRQALSMMKACYDAYEQLYAKPHLTFATAFEHQSSVVLWFRDDAGGLRPWTLRFPRNRKSPFVAAKPGSPEDWVVRPLDLLAGWLYAGIDDVSNGEQAALREGLAQIDALATRLSKALPTATDDSVYGDLSHAVAWSRALAVDSDRASSANILGLLANFMLALIWGVLHDRLLSKGFDRIDHRNFDDWLRRHGALDETLNSPFALSSPNVLFAYPRGDTALRPQMAAGCFAHWTLRTLDYARSYMWLFKGGTGETIISPLYLALRARGVRFAFFHKVEALRARKGSNGPELSEIRIAVQAEPNSGDYDPLIQPWPRIDGRRWPCWPEAPNFDQLRNGAALKQSLAQADTHLESYWNRVPPVRHQTLTSDPTAPSNRRFDAAILAISRGALPILCGDLIRRSQDWADMVAGLPAIPTQAAQIWLEPEIKDLNRELRPRGGNIAVGATYFGPMSGQIDFSRLIDVEKWPKSNRPGSLLYFCGAMGDRHGEAPLADRTYPALMRTRAFWQTYERLHTAALPLLPGSARPGPTSRDPLGLDFDDLVCDPPLKAEGIARLDCQFVRSNFEPSERYVLSPPNSTAARLRPYRSGFNRLFLAGDWTYSGLNVGCVEATVASGHSAALGAAGEPEPGRPLRQIRW